jgi:hypothetical protein
VLVQLGTDNNEIEVGATGSIAITGSRGSSNSWNFDTLLFNPSGSYPATGSNTGSADILISATASYISPTGSNIQRLTDHTFGALASQRSRSHILSKQKTFHCFMHMRAKTICGFTAEFTAEFTSEFTAHIVFARICMKS